ncbi:MAG: flagellar motor protein MotB [bacterium]|nr:flagellar motor protein MotB [Myxococcales bacterium]
MERRVPDDNESWLLSYADLITNLLIFFVMLLSMSEISTTRMQALQAKLSGKESPASLASIREEIDARIRAEKLDGVVATTLTDEGLKLSLNSGIVFDSAQAEIRPEMEAQLATMLQTLVPYAGRYHFAVEGHTDDRPITGRYASNWELSTARANAVRVRLEGVGVDANRVRVEGYADTQPLPAEEVAGLSDEERLARHRRVVVRVY